MNDAIKQIGVAGTFCLDTIYPYGGGKITGMGGIYYSLAVLSNLFGAGGRIYPFVHVGSDLYPRLPQIFRNYSNIDRSGFIKVPSPNNRVTCKYFSPSEREEFSTFVPPPLRAAEINCQRTYDIFFVNFISGEEMKISTLAQLSEKINGPVYIDVHTLVMGFGEGGRRFFRKPKGWRRVIASGDIIQMNDREAEVLDGFYHKTEDEYKKFGFQLLELGPKVVLFTLGEQGSFICYRRGKKFYSGPIDPFSLGFTREVTGCGDVYAGGFILKYLESGNPVHSAQFASRVAGIKAGYKGSRNLFRIRKYLASHSV